MGCIFHVFGILSSYVMGDRTLTMVKGPSLFGANFGLDICRFRLQASSQTLSPFLNREKGLRERRAMT